MILKLGKIADADLEPQGIDQNAETDSMIFKRGKGQSELQNLLSGNELNYRYHSIFNVVYLKLFLLS